MKTGFIGAGKAGTSLGIYFKSKGIPVVGYYSKSIESSKQAADFTKSTAFSDLEELTAKSDMIFITTPDGIIGQVAKELSQDPAKYDIKGKYLCHLSGSLSSESLLCAGEKCASAHPMMAISSRHTDLSQAFFTLEGEEGTVEALKQLFAKCGNPMARIRTEKKGEYHCAAGIASNLIVALAGISLDMLEECGFSRESALQVLTPLMKNNIHTVCEKGPTEALTGPVERGDTETVKMHLEILTGVKESSEALESTGVPEFTGTTKFAVTTESISTSRHTDTTENIESPSAYNSTYNMKLKEIYRLLSLKLVDIAQEKNKDRNYNKLKELLEEKNEEHSSYIQKCQGR